MDAQRVSDLLNRLREEETRQKEVEERLRVLTAEAEAGRARLREAQRDLARELAPALGTPAPAGQAGLRPRGRPRAEPGQPVRKQQRGRYREALMNLLANGQPWNFAALEEALAAQGLPANNLHAYLNKGVVAGDIVKVDRGLYQKSAAPVV